jgi:hypothetical protein
MARSCEVALSLIWDWCLGTRPAIETALSASNFEINLHSLFLSHIPFNCTFITMGGGGKIPYVFFSFPDSHHELIDSHGRYPKEVWSPAGGWYAQPANWRVNTAIMGAFVFGVAAVAFSLSAEREYRDKMPEPGRFFPSR